jgi:hypothetical protein
VKRVTELAARRLLYRNASRLLVAMGIMTSKG